MNQYYAEGVRLDTPDNLAAVRSAAGLARAMEEGTILAARAVLCDAQNKKRRGAFHMRPSTGRRSAGAYRMRPYGGREFLSGAPATRSTRFIIYYLLSII